MTAEVMKKPQTEESEAKPKYRPAEFGPTFKGNFPPEMRRQMWPLCCGMSILSGFKSVNEISEDELIEQIEYVCTKPRPDFQIFVHEQMKPAMTWLTLNADQMKSQKIMKCIDKCGFKMVGYAKPRGRPQGMFLRDTSGTWTITDEIPS
jgi:hypothetical protein